MIHSITELEFRARQAIAPGASAEFDDFELSCVPLVEALVRKLEADVSIEGRRFGHVFLEDEIERKTGLRCPAMWVYTGGNNFQQVFK